MRDHYFFLQAFYAVKSFFQEAVYLFFRNPEQSYVCSPCPEYSDILVFYRVAVYVLHFVEFGKEISCSQCFMISRNQQHFLLSLDKRSYYAFNALLCICKVTA